MNATTEQVNKLRAKLPQERVSKRQGPGGRQLSYVEWHDCVRSANDIFGFCCWSSETIEMIELCAKEVPKSSGGTQWFVAYRAKVRVTALESSYDGWGYGEGYDQSLGQAHESAFKEAESDAAKRAMRNMGDQFGLALYDKAQDHVEKTSPKATGEKATTTGAKYPGSGEYLKSLGMDADMVAKFKNDCQSAGREWGEVAIQLKAQGINTLLAFADAAYKMLGAAA